MIKRILGLFVVLALVVSLPFAMSASAQGKTVLVVAQGGDIESLDAVFALGPSYNAIQLCANWQYTGYKPVQLKNGLLTVDATTHTPRIVEKWEDSPLPGGRHQYTLHLRRGMTHHSGNPVTAHDIAWFLRKERAAERDTMAREFGYFDADKDLEIVDDYTLRINTGRFAPLFHHTVMKTRALYDSKKIEEMAGANDPWGKEVVKNNCVAGGPYKLVKWTRGVEMVFERFPEWWGNNTFEKSSIDQIVLRVIPAVETRVLLLQRGEVDLALDLPIKEINRLRRANGVKVLSYPSNNLLVGQMNPTIKPFNNVKVRQALSYAFPYNAAIKEVYRGDARRMTGPLPIGVKLARKTPAYSTDLKKAKQLLVEAGYGKGLTIPLAFDARFSTHEDLAVLYKANLQKIGVKLNIRKLPSAQYATEGRAKKLPFFFWEILWWVPDPGYIMLFSFLTESVTNQNNYSNSRVDALIREGLVEKDQTQRLKILDQAQNLVLKDVPWVFVAQPNFNLAMRDNIDGYVHQNTELHHLWFLKKKTR